MRNNYESFDNLETSVRKSSVVQERSALVAVRMYKQFLDYQHATMNTTEVFSEMIDNLKAIADSLKQSFSANYKDYVLWGGEDFQLLFSVPEEVFAKLVKKCRSAYNMFVRF